ncbi:GAF domain-containing protein [Mycolicibacterium pyrenivorans]|uniref:GAF domain-containing protein n=1 Tax=Mycolicibacterium pyrenivorans TaxID=187102 RepID=UPI0021F3C505|nr:GAF domain-containing protein [Mycolicibacterium pyrenivorans]MCV7154321.1 GAF domain-containing protein [Mycolicibacterium pyrenivorans]
MTAVYRAPMRSRRDDIDPQGALDRAQALGLCGFGGHDDPVRLARRIERFAEVADGSFVWTRDVDGLYWLGRLDGAYFYDADGESVDLVHVRPCEWRTAPMAESAAPTAVVATFGRGGRNFQRIHDAAVGDESARLWVSSVSGRTR